VTKQKNANGRSQLTKAGLTEAVYQRHGGLSKTEAGDAVDSVLESLKSGLRGGRKIKITNFGVFEIKSRRGRTGVDPVSGERIAIPAHRGLAFRPSERLRSLVQAAPLAPLAPVAPADKVAEKQHQKPTSLILFDTKRTDDS
jgi:nucleoid DNA-binding protein